MRHCDYSSWLLTQPKYENNYLIQSNLRLGTFANLLSPNVCNRNYEAGSPDDAELFLNTDVLSTRYLTSRTPNLLCARPVAVIQPQAVDYGYIYAGALGGTVLQFKVTVLTPTANRLAKDVL